MRRESDLPRSDHLTAMPAEEFAPGAAAAAAQGPRGRRKAGLWPFAALLFMGVVWGATFSLAKIATEGGAHPLGLTLWQGLLGGALLLLVCLARRQVPAMSRRHARFYVVCALLGTVLPGTLFFHAAPHVPAGVLAITVATVPILTYAMTLALKVDALSPGRILGLVLGLGAVVLIVAPEAALPGREAVPWVLIALLASACYAGENLYVALKRPAGSDSLAIVAGMLVMAALMLAPVVAATGSFVPLAPPWGAVEWSVIGMTLANAVAYTIFVQVIQSAGPVFAAQTAYPVTLAGVFWGMAIFGEQHSLWIWAALAVMLAGLALVTPRART